MAFPEDLAGIRLWRRRFPEPVHADGDRDGFRPVEQLGDARAAEAHPSASCPKEKWRSQPLVIASSTFATPSKSTERFTSLPPSRKLRRN